MGTIKIGLAKDSDSQGLTHLYRKLYEGDEEKKFYSSKVIPSHIRFGSKVFVARANKKIVGFCWAVWYEHIKNKGVGVIEELYVDKEYRRKKVGKKSFEAGFYYVTKLGNVITAQHESKIKAEPERKTAEKSGKTYSTKEERRLDSNDFRYILHLSAIDK